MAVEYARRLGILAIPVVRMNEMHDQFFLYEVSRFKLANPRRGKPPAFARDSLG